MTTVNRVGGGPRPHDTWTQAVSGVSSAGGVAPLLIELKLGSGSTDKAKA